MHQIFKFILLLLLTSLTLSDCPVQYYPSQTIIGFINAEINGDPQKQNSEQTYTFTMKDPLSSATPDVLLGVNAIDFQFTEALSYKVLHKPTPKFGMVNFNVLVEDKSFKWKRLQFNFIATNHPQMSAGFVSFNTFTNTTQTRHNLVTSIKVNDYMKAKPIVQAYVSGISLRANMNKSEQQKLLKQIDTLKRSPFSWNKAQSAVLSRFFVAQSSLSYEIISSSLSNNSLAITFQTSDTLTVQSLTVSYIIFNEMEFPLKNNLIHQSLALSPQKSSFQFSPLTNTDMTFIGLRGAMFNINQPLGIQFLVTKSKGILSISQAKTLLEGTSLYVSFFQTQTKYENQCENCPDSIFRLQTYCLSSCPRGYVGVKNGTKSFCSYCDISSFLIPNTDGNQCTCATQYFYNKSSTKCQSCHYSCLTCKDSSTTCLTCDSNDKTTKRFFNQSSKLCDCVDGFFDNKNLVCEKCHPTCLTCSGSSIHQCRTCKEDRTLDSTNRCVCGPNFSDQNNECVCKQPNSLMKGVCYSTNVVSNSSCNKPNMIESITNGRKICICEKGYEMFNNECISCPKTFILNKQTGICQCPKTAYLNTQTGQCVQCESMKYYEQRLQKCLCKKQYFEKQDGTCVDCPDKSVYKDGKCICVFNYYLKNEKCVKCMKTQDDPNCLRVNPNQL